MVEKYRRKKLGFGYFVVRILVEIEGCPRTEK
jgi:hypothetical protein